MLSSHSSVLLSAHAPSADQRRAIHAISVLLLLGFVAAIPFAHAALWRIPNFIVAQESILCISALITAALIFAQFSIQPSAQLIILAASYLLSSLLLIPHMLTFPGAFAETGLLGASPQTPPWLYLTWRAVTPLSIIAYVLAGRRNGRGRWTARVGPTIAATTAAVVGVVIAITFVTTALHDWLPVVISGINSTPTGHLVVGCIFLAILCALAILVLLPSPSLLDVWLTVVMLAWACAAATAFFLGGARYAVGDYVGRLYATVASCLMLVVLLSEVTSLYAKVLRASANEHRERERRLMESEAILVHLARVSELGQIVSSLIHEVNQPLSAVNLYLSGAIRLARSGDMAKTTEAMERSREQVERASGIIRRLRDYIARREIERSEGDIRAMLADAVRLAMVGVEAAAPDVELTCEPGAASAFFDRVQIEQVVFNLVRNAIEAMASSARRMLTVAATLAGDNMVEVSVTDTGTGLSPTVRERLFQPFVTTKTSGLGIGLSICRVIVEAHGGRLHADNNPAGGTIFRFTLPRTAATQETPGARPS